jgi:hypothetical protein
MVRVARRFSPKQAPGNTNKGHPAWKAGVAVSAFGVTDLAPVSGFPRGNVVKANQIRVRSFAFMQSNKVLVALSYGKRRFCQERFGVLRALQHKCHVA